MKKYADLIQVVSLVLGWERGAICGYDLFMAIEDKTIDGVFKAWRRYLKEVKDGAGHTDALRYGAWVPAVLIEEL